MLGRSEVRALGRYLHAGYALRAAGEGRRPEQDPSALEADLTAARDALAEALVAAGADPARVADEANLLPVAHEAAQRGDRYAFVFAPDPSSFAVVRLRTRRRRERVFFGEAFDYTLLEYDEVLVEDYPAFLGGGGAPQPASYSSAGQVRVDYAAIVEIGKRQFLPRAEELVGAIHVPDEAFLERSGADAALELLSLTKAVLRGRSVEPLWSRLQPRPADERLQGFVQDYAAHAELRAAAELFALQTDPGEAPDPRSLAQRGALVAMLHDEPLGHLADLVGLAIVAVQTESELPALLGARELLVEFLAELREGEGPAADARACARLARLSAKEIRDLAQALWNKRAN
ncbi:MAG: hypothetical protein R3F62_21240 [Planctomycetota bacterium]